MKTQTCSARFDQRTKTITLSFDRETFHNLHFVEGFERAFDQLVEVLSEKFEVRVEKKEWVCADDCVNCSETGSEYTVQRKVKARARV